MLDERYLLKIDMNRSGRDNEKYSFYGYSGSIRTT